METTGSGRPLDETERAELVRLRQEISQVRQPSAGPERPAAALRLTAAVLLLVLVAVLGFSAVMARFARSQVLDTDRYVATVTPLSSDPAIQRELTAQITTAIMTRLDVDGLARQALREITSAAPRVPSAVVGLAPLISAQAQTYVQDTVASVLRSDEFGAFWVQANRKAHQELVAVLTGDTPAAIDMDSKGTVSISLAPVIDRVRGVLVSRGFIFAESIPAPDKYFVLFQSPELVKAQRWVSWLDWAADVLPWAALLAAGCAVGIAPGRARLRVLSLVGVVLAVAMALLAAGIGIGREAYLRAIPADVLSRPAAAALIDVFLVQLRTSLRAVFILALVVAVVGYLAGQSSSAVALRAWATHAKRAIQARRVAQVPGPLQAAAARLRTPLRVATIAIALTVLAFWPYPTGLVVAVTVLAAAAVLLLVELLAAPAVADSVASAK